MATYPTICAAVFLALASQPPAASPQRLPVVGQPRFQSEQPAATRYVVSGPSAPSPAIQSSPTARGTQTTTSNATTVPLETLDQAWNLALAANQRLEATRWNISSTEQSLQLARSQRWPTMDLEGSYMVRSAEPAFQFDFGPIPVPSNFARYEQKEGGAFRTAVDVPLYTSGRIRYGIDAAEAKVASAGFEFTELVNDLRMHVAEDYVAVLRAQHDLEVVRSTVRSLKAHEHEVEMLFKHSQVPRNDLLAAQVALSDAQQAAIQAANRLDASRAAYNRQLGRPLEFPVRIAELPLESVQGDVESLTARALQNRPELAGLTTQAQSLQYQATSLSARNRPQVSVHGEYAFEQNRYRSPDGIAAVGVVASWNLFDGGRNRHERTALQQRAESLVRFKRDLESKIALQVRRAWLDIHETRRRMEVTSQAIARADENLRVARTRYAAGAAINTEVLDAESLRTQTYRNHSNAVYDSALAVLRLKHATGELK
ncbi:MAG: TolC family protein [Pirellulales bacterium]|nr:TolC family protein [Pirellulales bacterium]